MDNAKISGHHWKIMFISGMGFFTNVYDLFISGIVMTLRKDLWHVGKLEEVSWSQRRCSHRRWARYSLVA